MASALHRLGRAAYRRRRRVLAIWLVLFAAIFAGAATLSGPTDGTLFWLTLFYGMELLVVFAGLWLALDNRGRRSPPAPLPPGSKTMPDRV